MTINRPLWTVLLLAAYLPFESFILKFIPQDIYVFARYFSEGLIYVLALVVLWKVLTRQIPFRRTPIDLAFVLFLVVLFASVVINVVSPTIAILGIRQILRFVFLFFIVVYLHPPKKFMQQLTRVMLVIVLFQSLLGISQSIMGEPLDLLLLPSESRTYGEVTLTAGVNQFWDPGSRIFGTLGRYDRLGNFLYLFLLIVVAGIYEWRKGHNAKGMSRRLWILLGIGLIALILTYSRASWFAFLLGFLFITVIVYRDKRMLLGFFVFVAVAFGYLGLTGLNVKVITEAPGQTLVERFYETFSYARWRGEYYGLGRTYWMIQTPVLVMTTSPFFGFGPGQFGAGAVAALHNTTAYDQLGIPFGIFGTDGVIDNNWFSLWGETGTLGFLFYSWMWVALFIAAIRLFQKSKDPFTRSLAISFAAILIAVGFNGFLSTILEIRTVAFYLWLYGGFVVVLGSDEGIWHKA